MERVPSCLSRRGLAWGFLREGMETGCLSEALFVDLGQAQFDERAGTEGLD